MEGSEEKRRSARRILKYIGLSIGVVVFVPLIFQTRFRQLIGLALLGVLYSSFFISSWDRWVRRVDRFRNTRWGWLLPRGLARTADVLLPLKAWGVVPFLIQSLVFVVVFGCFWFLGPVLYKVMRNPTALGLLRDLFEKGTPVLFRFLDSLATNQEPMRVLKENARQVFVSMNQFISFFIFPLVFIGFSGIGAALYSSINKLLIRAEAGENLTYSKILDRYSRLFANFIWFNSVYYFGVATLIGILLGLTDFLGVTDFGWKLTLGVLVTFFAGNLLIPGAGTMVMSVLIVGLFYLEQGIFGAVITAILFMVFFGLDDYVLKPWFLAWLGAQTTQEWEFSAEIILIGLIILYAAFGIVGALLLFPGLCFLDAYLRYQFPEIRTWIMHPLKTVTEGL